MSVETTGVVIVGAGLGGLAMAIELARRGRRDFVLLERGAAVGGTWRDNHYPGCACDVPAHLYSFSSARNPDWSRAYAPHDEIRAYVERVVGRFALGGHVRLNTRVSAARFDEAGAHWSVETEAGVRYVGGALVLATGGLSRPAIPPIAGLDRFRGDVWHSAAWRHDVDLAGARVAAIGTGASAIQFVPALAAAAGRLHVFQRTPPWILPRPDRRFGPLERALLALPPIGWAYRQALYLGHEARALPMTVAPDLMRLGERLARRHLARQVADPALRRALTPTYRMGCKRVLLSNDYYPALARANVELVTAPIREVGARSITTVDGGERPVDAIVLGTGFAVHDYLGGLAVLGRQGRALSARWQGGAEAYLGTTVPGFPNLFLVIGPNTGLGHNSILVMIEAQARYIGQALAALPRGAWLEPRAEVNRRYNDALQARLAHTVWSSGCDSWYRDRNGRNTTLWPGTTLEFIARTRRFDARDFHRGAVAGAAARDAA